MPRKRKEEPEAPKVIPELEALPPRRRKLVENYTNPDSPTFGNATRSYVEAGHTDYPTVRIDAHRALHEPNVERAIKAVYAATGASLEARAELLWEYAQDRDPRVRTSSVRSLELIARHTGELASESEVQLQQLVLPQLGIADIRAALASGRAETEGNDVSGG